MADESNVAEEASTNGSGPVSAAASTITQTGSSLAGAGGRFLGGLLDRFRDRLDADLDDRDPDYIRDNLPLSWLLATIWFRGEVRNLGNIPERGPVLMVGNHSGGNLTPDTLLFTLAFYTYFGIERPFYQLAHNLVLASPVGPILKRYGTMAASHEHARQALEAEAAVLVYPGGDWEVHRSTRERNKVDFGGRSGFVRLAMNAGVPIVPVVAVGGQETALFLTRGDRIAKALRLDKALRLKVLPISIAPPWGLNIGDFLSHIPLPAKLTVEVLPPIDIRAEFGDDPDLDEVRAHIERLMQDTLDALAAERRYPVIG